MNQKTNPAFELMREFAQGFGLVVGVSVVIGAIGFLLLNNIDAGFDPKDAFYGFLLLFLLALLTIGGELALSILISDSKCFGGRFTFMQFLGGISAWVSAFYYGPFLIDHFERPESEETCETLFEMKLGPVTFSQERCDE